jgi:hypothetical protein
MLAGPAVVGFISSRTSLGIGLLVAVGALAFAAAAAGVVRAPAAAEAPRNRGMTH